MVIKESNWKINSETFPICSSYIIGLDAIDDGLNGVVVSVADCYPKGVGFDFPGIACNFSHT
jgi:hypothetical protein